MKRVYVGDFPLGEEEKAAINEVLDKGRISEDRKVREFERLFASYIGCKYAVAVNSGTSALIAGLTAIRYMENSAAGSRRKAITTPLTYIATSNALIAAGFEPVYVDVDLETFNITPENIQAHLEDVASPEEYSLILPVHLMGYPCDMEKIAKVAEEYGLLVVEDSAQAHGTLYQGKKLGAFSLLSTFSFYIAHNIQAGELGAVVTSDAGVARLVRKIKANGRMCDCLICTRSRGKCPLLDNYQGEEDFDPRFTHDLIGYNFKTMEFPAALAVTQLKKADWIAEKRRQNVRFLNEGLEEFSFILKLPRFMDTVSYIAYPIVIKDPARLPRKALRRELEARGVETRPLFGCIPTQQPAYSYLKEEYSEKLPNAEYLGKNAFYVGCHQYLQEEDLNWVITAFGEVLKKLL